MKRRMQSPRNRKRGSRSSQSRLEGCAEERRSELAAANKKIEHEMQRRKGLEGEILADEPCPTGIEGLDEEPADRHEPMAQVLDNELAEVVQRAIAGLPPLQREALVLFEYDELSLAEIAAIVGAEANTVKARLFRAREKLRAGLDRYFRIGRETATLKRA